MAKLLGSHKKTPSILHQSKNPLEDRLLLAKGAFLLKNFSISFFFGWQIPLHKSSGDLVLRTIDRYLYHLARREAVGLCADPWWTWRISEAWQCRIFLTHQIQSEPYTACLYISITSTRHMYIKTQRRKWKAVGNLICTSVSRRRRNEINV